MSSDNSELDNDSRLARMTSTIRSLKRKREQSKKPIAEDDDLLPVRGLKFRKSSGLGTRIMKEMGWKEGAFIHILTDLNLQGKAWEKKGRKESHFRLNCKVIRKTKV